MNGGDKMAEFCPNCWNKLHGTKYLRCEFRLTYHKELCEGCGQYKRVVMEKAVTYYDTRFILIEWSGMLLRVMVNGAFDLLDVIEQKEKKQGKEK